MVGIVIKGETSTGVPVTAGFGAREKLAPRIAVLDGFRALAILLVLFYHYTVRWAPPQDFPPHLPSGQIWAGFLPFEYGWFGVELFFVISGFVIAKTLERCRNLADFALRRLARLWPAMVAGAALTALVMVVAGPADWQVGFYDYLTSILFLSPNITSAILHGAPVKWADGAYWSLWVEVRFYGLAAFFYLLAGRNFIKPWLVFFLTTSLLQHLAAPAAGSPAARALDLFCFPKYLAFFTLGICLHALYAKGAGGRWAMAGAALAAGSILYEAAFGENVFLGSAFAVSISLVLMLFALLALFLASSPLLAPFRWPPIVALGQASYSLYLIHEYIGVALMRRCVDTGLPYFLALPLVCTGVVAVALLMFRFIEIPGKSWILRPAQRIVMATDRRVPWLAYQRAD